MNRETRPITLLQVASIYVGGFGLGICAGIMLSGAVNDRLFIFGVALYCISVVGLFWRTEV